jgi:NifU-like protein
VYVVTDIYPETITRRVNSPRNAGTAVAHNAAGAGAAFQCGTVVRFSLRIDSGTKKLEEVRFRTNGCGYMTAAADVLCDLLAGRSLQELSGADPAALTAEISSELGAFPENRSECVLACIDTLRAAFADFRSRQIAEFASEEALICTCFGVSERTIEAKIGELGLATVDAVGAACNAGNGCGSCRMLIQAMLDSRSGGAF